MSREPFDLDPDEARVRSLIRRSDGPVTVRSFQPDSGRGSFVPIVAATAAVFVIAVVVGTSLADQRQDVGSRPLSTVPPPPAAASRTPSSTTQPSATPNVSGMPVSAGAVPEAGVLFVRGSDDRIYRYVGATGELAPIPEASTFIDPASPSGAGVLVFARDGSVDLLQWGGGVTSAVCGAGHVAAASSDGSACVFQNGIESVEITGPTLGRTSRLVLPIASDAGGFVWDVSGSRLAFLRHSPGPEFDQRGHNTLWAWDAERGLRQLYEPPSPTAFVFSAQWSPDGRWVTVLESSMISNSIAADGVKLLLIDAAAGTVADLGMTVGRDWRVWSPSGELAFIRGGGRQTWFDKRLVIRAVDGSQREVALPDAGYVQLAPAWSASGHLAFVIGPSSGEAGGSGYMDGTGVGDRRSIVLAPDGSRREVRCPESALEGILPSDNASTFLLLCRAPGADRYPFSLWLLPPSGSPVALIRGLAFTPDTGGFGYYGKHPHLTTITAWSLATR